MASKNATHNAVPKLYNDIIKDVISSVRDDFMNESIDESVLEDLNKLWLKKLEDTGATRTLTSSAVTAINKNVSDSHGGSNVVYVGPKGRNNLTLPGRHPVYKKPDGVVYPERTTIVNSTSQNSRFPNQKPRFTNFTSGDKQIGNSTRRFIQIPSNNSAGVIQQKYQTISSSTVNRAVRPNPKPYGQARTGGVVHSTAPVNISPTSGGQNQRQAVIKQNTQTVISGNRRMPLYSNQIAQKNEAQMAQHRGQAQSNQQAGGQLQSMNGQQSVQLSSHEQQSNLNDSYSSNEYGVESAYSSSASQNNIYFSQTDGPLGDDEFDSDSSLEDSDEETEEIQNSEPAEAENPLGSDDDLDGADDDDAIFETDNQIVCQYDKIQRVKNKWRFCLKDGIMHLHGRDFVFQKASGDGEW
ncbi:Oidioi.mRNA.OKI2018_I69.XSR.g16823.t1.cds [Oikopleura dioica]|uniref:Oidioi.mRNA.OKI2018_I69.XSR.g16823.t1.cds n=1 Tax=Oikopleura dioica TaxID=34765 RepID=A0ABN7SPL4_OIKDI|nr:Oidioi.mRNA.OKI2018_I69.XSR.g16823.t1.cds [Oikopleura dioica]